MSKNDPCSIATEFYVKISKCTTIIELNRIGVEIKASLKNVEGWVEWLRCGWQSQYDTLSAPKLVPEECLNAKGIAALKRKEITLEQ